MCCHDSICYHVPIVVLQNTAVLSCFRDSGRKMDVSEGDLLLLDDVPGLRTLLLTNLDLLKIFKEAWYF